MYHACSSYYYVIYLIFLSIIAVSFVAFIGIVYGEFDNIIAVHNTISSFCSDPNEFGSRFLLTITAIIGPSLIALNVLAQSASNQPALEDGKFIATVVANLMLPMVGIWYTRGKGMTQNTYYELGPWKCPIWISEALHSIAALVWMFTETYLNVHFASELLFTSTFDTDHSKTSATVYFFFAVLTAVILFIFIAAQGIIFLLERKIDFTPSVAQQTSPHVLERKSSSRECAIKHQKTLLQINRSFYVVSFIAELITITAVATLSFISAIWRRDLYCTPFL